MKPQLQDLCQATVDPKKEVASLTDRDVDIAADDSDDYGSDDFEGDESVSLPTGVSDNDLVDDDGSHVGTSVHRGMHGVRQMAGTRRRVAKIARDDNKDNIESKCEYGGNEGGGVYCSSKSAVLLPQLFASPEQSRGSKVRKEPCSLPAVKKTRIDKDIDDSAGGEKECKRVSKKKKSTKAIDDESNEPKKKGRSRGKKGKKCEACFDKIDSPHKHPVKAKHRPSCSECGFHFVGAGMKLPTTLQQIMDYHDDSEVGAGYNSRRTNFHQHQAVRDLFGWRRGDGCMFCSWGCARVWNQKHTPVQLKYQTDRLITIAASANTDI